MTVTQFPPPPTPKCHHRKVRASNIKGIGDHKHLFWFCRDRYSLTVSTPRSTFIGAERGFNVSLLSGQEFSTPLYWNVQCTRVRSLSPIYDSLFSMECIPKYCIFHLRWISWTWIWQKNSSLLLHAILNLFYWRSYRKPDSTLFYNSVQKSLFMNIIL